MGFDGFGASSQAVETGHELWSEGNQPIRLTQVRLTRLIISVGIKLRGRRQRRPQHRHGLLIVTQGREHAEQGRIQPLSDAKAAAECIELAARWKFEVMKEIDGLLEAGMRC